MIWALRLARHGAGRQNTGTQKLPFLVAQGSPGSVRA